MRTDGPLRSSSIVRLLVGAVAGVAVAAAVSWTSVVAAVLAGWATVAAVFVVWTWAVCAPMDADETAAHSTREEPTRVGAHVVVLAAAVVTLASVVVVLVQKNIGQLLPTIAVLSSVLASWAAIHTVFALRYARMYL